MSRVLWLKIWGPEKVAVLVTMAGLTAWAVTVRVTASLVASAALQLTCWPATVGDGHALAAARLPYCRSGAQAGGSNWRVLGDVALTLDCVVLEQYKVVILANALVGGACFILVET